MISKFQLHGLSKPKSAVCAAMDNGPFFWPKVELEQDRFDALFDYCKGAWSDYKLAVIEHDGLSDNGMPINPRLIGIEEPSE